MKTLSDTSPREVLTGCPRAVISISTKKVHFDEVAMKIHYNERVNRKEMHINNSADLKLWKIYRGLSTVVDGNFKPC